MADFKNIVLIDYKPEHLVTQDGFYLLRAIDSNFGTIKHYVVYCYKKMNYKTGLFQTFFDKKTIENNFVLQISKLPLK